LVTINFFFIILKLGKEEIQVQQGPQEGKTQARPHQQPGANVIKHFSALSYNFSLSAIAFAPGKPFHPCQMFADKARAYPSEAPFRCSTLG
jgi:hypothetical protein